ncbi:hypothetical protein SAMD00023353_1202290 [Rosellinia necatrix]|uniref:Uncharacterized protein n=1 Tax=Rosellinia necatrix TaxID=77044 RepID=A0A1S8A6Q3_ROSNE|nr:hypothetical protein SAMD00023353_1202290 [Rosellinia necatrix]
MSRRPPRMRARRYQQQSRRNGSGGAGAAKATDGRKSSRSFGGMATDNRVPYRGRGSGSGFFARRVVRLLSAAATYLRAEFYVLLADGTMIRDLNLRQDIRHRDVRALTASVCRRI